MAAICLGLALQISNGFLRADGAGPGPQRFRAARRGGRHSPPCAFRAVSTRRWCRCSRWRDSSFTWSPCTVASGPMPVDEQGSRPITGDWACSPSCSARSWSGHTELGEAAANRRAGGRPLRHRRVDDPSIARAADRRARVSALRDLRSSLGANPYAITFPDIYRQNGDFYGPGLSVGGRLQFGFPYFPLSLLLVDAGATIRRRLTLRAAGRHRARGHFHGVRPAAGASASSPPHFI